MLATSVYAYIQYKLSRAPLVKLTHEQQLGCPFGKFASWDHLCLYDMYRALGEFRGVRLSQILQMVGIRETFSSRKISEIVRMQ